MSETNTKEYLQAVVASDSLVKAQVNISRLESEVNHLTASVIDIKNEHKAIFAKLDAIQATLSEARGGWKTLMWVGGAAATVGAMVSWVTSHLNWHG